MLITLIKPFKITHIQSIGKLSLYNMNKPISSSTLHSSSTLYSSSMDGYNSNNSSIGTKSYISSNPPPKKIPSNLPLDSRGYFVSSNAVVPESFQKTKEYRSIVLPKEQCGVLMKVR